MSSYDFLGLPLLENAVAAMTAARAATPHVFSGSAGSFTATYNSPASLGQTGGQNYPSSTETVGSVLARLNAICLNLSQLKTGR